MLALLALFARQTLAAPPPMQFRHFGVDEGLPSSQVTDVLRDRRGYMWIGTAHGVSRFDSHHFRVYGVGTEGGLTEGLVRQVFEDRTGVIWVVTSTGLSHYSSAVDAFVSVPARLLGNDPNQPPALTCVAEDSRGRLLIGSSQGLLIFDRSTGKATPLHSEPSADVDPPVNAMHLDAQGTLWIGSDWGLYRIDRDSTDSSGWTAVMGAPNDRDSVIRAIASDARGNLWIGTGYAGVIRRDHVTGEVTRFQNDPARPESISGNRIAHIIAQRDGPGVWIGVENGGVNLFDPVQNVFHHVRNDPFDPYSLASNAVWALFQDDAGLLWVGTFSAGLDVSLPQSAAIRHYRAIPGVTSSLSFNAVTGFLADPDGRVWVSTDGGGLNRFDQRSGIFERFTTGNTNLDSDAVLSIARARDGALWIATWAGGVSRFDPVARRFDAYTTRNSDLPNDNVYEIIADRDGDIWVGTDNGIVARLDPQRRRFSPKFDVVPRGFKWSSVLVLRQLADGRFAAGLREGGLSILDARDGRQEHYLVEGGDGVISANMVRTLHESEPGILWVGTDAGLDRIDLRTRARIHLDVRDGLPSRYVDGVVSDADGMLWISTDNGLSRLDPKSMRFRTFSRADGLQANEFLMRSVYRAPDGVLFFGGNNGFNQIRPALIRKASSRPEVVLTDLLLFNRTVRPGLADSPLAASVDELDSLQVTHQQNSLGFRFTALEYSSPGSVRYAYRLKPFDRDWQEVRTQREATYTNLPPGQYTFQVRASDVDGEWRSESRPLSLIVRPAYWQTWWFRSFVALLVLGALTWLWRFQRAETRKNEEARAIRRSERQLRLLIEHTPAAVAMVDREMRYLMTSRRWLEDYGLTAHPIIGRTHYEVLPELAQMPQWRDVHRRALAGESFPRREDSWVRADGRREWVEWAIHPWHDSQGEIGGIVLFTEFITARKTAEQSLRSSEERNRAAMEFAPTGKALARPDGRFTSVNPALCKLLGLTEADLLTRDLESIVHTADQSGNRQHLQRLLRGELESYELEIRCVHRSGREIYCLLSVAPVQSPSGEVEFLVVELHDISERKEMERLKSEFISVVSHELRSPLTSIQISLEVLAENADRSLSPRMARMVDISVESCERLVLLVNDILDIDKIAAGEMRFYCQPCSAADIVGKAIASMEAYAAKFNVTIEQRPLSPDAMINVDANRFIQAFANLLSNAAKFSPTGGKVVVGTSLSGPNLRVFVQDRGPGIPEEFRSRIFGRFAQADSGTTRRPGGTGLGLHITKALVENMGGRIGFESQPGAGTMFWIEFAVCSATEAGAARTNAENVVERP